MIPGGAFEFIWHDPLTNMLFMYFTEVAVQDVSKSKNITPITTIEAAALWLTPDQYQKMRDYFINNPTPETS